MSGSTEALIERLTRDAAPVRRLAPPVRRAVLWLACVAIVASACVAAFANMTLFMERAHHPALMVELAATLATGVLATIAGFELSLPDRSPRWVLAPLPALAVWLGSSGLGCLQSWGSRHTLGSLGGDDSVSCFRFILSVGLPLGGALLWALSRARPIAPRPVALTGGLAAAALAAFLLQFFHPFDVTVTDLAVHAVAVGLVVAAAGPATRLLRA